MYRMEFTINKIKRQRKTIRKIRTKMTIMSRNKAKAKIKTPKRKGGRLEATLI